MKRLLLGMAAACMATSMVAQTIVKDPATYGKVGEYTLESLWIQSRNTNNNIAEITGGNTTRGMALKGDELLFSYRGGDFTGIKVFELKTGTKKKILNSIQKNLKSPTLIPKSIRS